MSISPFPRRVPRLLHVALLLALAAPFASLAQDKPSDSTNTVGAHDALTVGVVDDLQMQIYRKKLQLDLAKVNSDLAKSGGAALSDGTAADVTSTAPFCSEVYGAPNDYTVVFLYADGSQNLGRRGDHIPGGWTVREVSLNKVRIERDGRIRDCGFSKTAPQPAAQQSQSSTSNGMPPGMPVMPLPPSVTLPTVSNVH